MDEKTQQLLEFFKALADESRLKIVGLLAQQPRSVDELAAMLGVSAPTVSHHLARLLAANLVEARAEQYYSVYSLKTDTLQQMSRELLTADVLAEAAEGVDTDAFGKKVLGDFVVRGRLKTIPAQLKKRQVILRWLADRFVPGKEYPEKQVNEMLKQVHEDSATLRRELVDYQYMTRKNGIYRRIEKDAVQK